MFIGYFTERPYQDPQSGFFGATGVPIKDLTLSNGDYNPELGANLYNRYLDEKIYAEEMGFDGLMLNEHHTGYLWIVTRSRKHKPSMMTNASICLSC